MRHINACLTPTSPTALSQESSKPDPCITDEGSITHWLVMFKVAIMHLVDEDFPHAYQGRLICAQLRLCLASSYQVHFSFSFRALIASNNVFPAR